jgi:CYTH domain-containing protein
MRSMKNRRRWVLAAPPPLDGKPFDEIRQGYVVTGAGEMQLRREGDSCFMTVKNAREEWETAIAGWVFDTVWPATKGKRLRKRRYSWREKRRRLELDVYEGKLEGLVVLECAVLPDWAAGARDVTDDPLFTNDSLALHGSKAIRRRLSE